MKIKKRPPLGAHIYFWLTTDDTFSALVGDRFSKNQGEQDITPPMVIYDIDIVSGESDLDGQTGDYDATVTFNICARTDDEGKWISDAIQDRLVGHSGTVAGVEITECTFDSDIEDKWSEVVDVYHRILSLSVSFRRAEATEEDL